MALLPNCRIFNGKGPFSCETCGYHDPEGEHPQTRVDGFCAWGYTARPTDEEIRTGNYAEGRCPNAR